MSTRDPGAITPASYQQVLEGRDGTLITVDGDVARGLAEIDPGLKLRYSKAGDYFVVYHEVPQPDGSVQQTLVFTALTCDHRIIARALLIGSDRYDYMAELERLDEQFERDIDHQRRERVGEIGERLAHAIRKDLGAKTKAFIPWKEA